MTPTQWRRVQDLVSATLDLPETDRGRFLENVCGTNSKLRSQIEGLVSSYEQADSLIEQAVESSAFEAFSSKSPQEGDRIGAYQITGIIGHGGMGTVFCARRIDEQFRHDVAIKVVCGGFGVTSEVMARFRAERQILATLTHVNIARLLDGGITDSGLPYLVMEYVEGTTIDRFVADQNPGVRDRLALFQQVCAAVQYAHQNLIVHRDIKPANVMITREGTPKLLDFGIAKLLRPDALGQTALQTRPADRLMTPEYASPEQIRGEAVTTATDVYGLGVLLYELLTGKQPFRVKNLSPAGLERLICDTPPERPSSARLGTGPVPLEGVSGDLDNIVLKAMHKDPKCRYHSAAELSEDIGRYLRGFPVIARPDSWRYRSSKFVRRHKLATLAGIGFVVTTASLSIGLAIQASRAKHEAQAAAAVAGFLGALFENFSPDKTQGRSASPREILDRDSEQVSSQFAGQPLVKARLLGILASTFYRLGALDRAELLANQAYGIQARLIGPDSEAAAESLRTLAAIASDRGDFDRSFKTYEKVFRIFTNTKGLNSTETAEVITDIGLLRWMVGDFKGAEQRDREAVAIWTKLKGPSDPHTLTSKSNLETTLADEGDYASAEALAREVLAARLRVLGPNHPAVAESLSNLAVVLERTNHLEEAQRMTGQALTLSRRVLGPEHPQIATILNGMDRISRKLGQYDDAERYGEEAVAMSTKLAGPHSLATAAFQNQLGSTMLAKGDFVRARELLEASLASRLAWRKFTNPELGDSYDRLGMLDLATKDLAGAERNVKLGLEMRERFWGHNSDSVASSLNHLGQVYRAEGRAADAEQSFREAQKVTEAKRTKTP